MNQKLSLPDKIVKNTVKEKLLKKYNENSLLRGLIQLVPYGGFIDTFISTSYNNILIERAVCFYEELGKGNIYLTPEIIQSEDFLHAYFNTVIASIHTKRREKIRFLARLLKNGLTSHLLSKADEYDEYLKILDELTYRELYVLYTLDTYESSTQLPKDGNEMVWLQNYWKLFVTEVEKYAFLSAEELYGFLIRLKRTGCYGDLKSQYWDTDREKGRLTETYYKLKSLIQLKGEDFIYYRKANFQS